MMHSGQPADLIFSSVEGSFAIVESMPAIAMDIETTLKARGARDVLVVATLAQAGRLLERTRLAIAIIDTRFAGPSALVLATSLASTGVPIVFLNADPAFSAAGPLSGVTVLPKPHGENDLVLALAKVLGLA